MRNLGGSFGISAAVGILTHRGQFHHARLAESVTHFSRAPLTSGPSLSAFDQVLDRQAQMWSYIDVFKTLTVLAACAIPVAFLLRSLKPEEAHAGH
jgi:DHA2 family multidrug resistance protein